MSARQLRSGNIYPSVNISYNDLKHRKSNTDVIDNTFEDMVDNGIDDNQMLDDYEVNDNRENGVQEGQVEEEDDDEEAIKLPKKPQNTTSYYSGLSEKIRNVESNTRSKQKSYLTSYKTSKSKSQSNCFIHLFMFLLVLLSGFSGYYYFNGFSLFDKQSNKTITKWQLFSEEFKNFHQKYSEVLPEIGFKVLNSSIKNVMNRTTVEPAVILLIASEDNTNVLNCLENSFVAILYKTYNEDNCFRINGKQTDSQDIVSKFERNFGVDGKHVIIVDNVESIAGQDLMSLHQFTDHKNSRFINAIIILKAINNENINLNKIAKSVDMDSIATELFQMKWKNTIKEEQRFALISRLTSSVVTIIGTNSINC
ncbi:uncharacterized protein LOC128954327 [Oppia nitens]|uniref:uncharacterized protein LOC128954327 n=1 Tax=Oppia nitens TaxID=1686743 RepID=UPI0023DC0C76|nr:uncharacterized protein LOC128954327 [Oppia nitens]